MASDDIDNKALTKMLAEAFKHLTGYSKFRKLNASMEAAIENLFDDESDWSDIVSEGNKKISAASRVIGVLKKRERFYKELGGLIGKPAKTTDEESSRYLRLMDSPLGKAGANDRTWEYALGADTGVRNDFSYLRDTEIRQNERSRFDTMMSRDLRKSLVLPDEMQYALGADTGVRDDFSYLREEEEEQTRRNIRRNRTKRSRRSAVALEGMDDYERFIHENKGRFGRDGAEQVFRQRLLKELPPFLKNTNLSTKTLISIDKAIKSVKGIPLIGKLMHPAALGFAALGIADAVMSSSDDANKTVTAWSASSALSGSPSRRFDYVARLAGAKDEQEVLKMYGSLLEKFGTEDAFAMMGHALRSAAPGVQRLSVARSRGIDEKQANALMYLAGEAPPESTSEAQPTAVRYSQLEDIENWGFRSGSSFTEKARSAVLWLPKEKSLEARGTSWLEILEAGNPSMWGNLIMRKVLGSPTDDIDEAIKRNIESMNAAESLDEAERQGDTTMNSNVRNSAIYITNMNVQTNDPKAFSEALDGMANGDNRGLLATSGNYVLA